MKPLFLILFAVAMFGASQASAYAATPVKTARHQLGCVADNSMPNLCVGESDDGRPAIGQVAYRFYRFGPTATIKASATYRSVASSAKIAWIFGIDNVQCRNQAGNVKEIYSKEKKVVQVVRKGVNRVSLIAQAKCPAGYVVTYMETVGMSAYSPNFKPRPAGVVSVDEADAIEIGETLTIEPNQPNVDAYIISTNDEFPSWGSFVDVYY